MGAKEVILRTLFCVQGDSSHTQMDETACEPRSTVEGGEGFGGLRADAEVSVGLAEEDGAVLRDDDRGGDGEAPAGFSGGLVV